VSNDNTQTHTAEVVAVVVRDLWDEVGERNVLVFRADGVTTHVFPLEHPVAVCYSRLLEENTRLAERLQAIAAILDVDE
jgi:hypothetical protein